MVPETSDGTPVQAMLTAKAARAAAAPRYAPTNRRPGKRSGLSLVWNAQTITGVSEEVSATYANPLLMRAALPTAVVGTPPTAPLFGRREESTPAPAHGRPLPCQASAAKDSTCSAPRVHKAPPSACPNLPAGWELNADGVRPFLPAAMAGAVKRAGPSPRCASECNLVMKFSRSIMPNNFSFSRQTRKTSQVSRVFPNTLHSNISFKKSSERRSAPPSSDCEQPELGGAGFFITQLCTSTHRHAT